MLISELITSILSQYTSTLHCDALEKLTVLETDLACSLSMQFVLGRIKMILDMYAFSVVKKKDLVSVSSSKVHSEWLSVSPPATK